MERDAIIDLVGSAPPALRETLGISSWRRGAALGVCCRADPAILFNRVLGAGVDSPISSSDLEALCAPFPEAGVSRYLVHVHPEARPRELRDWLVARGLRPFRRSWMKFARGVKPPPETSEPLELRLAGSEHATGVARILAECFGAKQETASWLASAVGRPPWRFHVALDRGEVVAIGALYARDGVAWLGFGATLPSHRGMGLQPALLARRIRDAIDLGCRLLTTETGEPVPGEPQPSYRNIERAGFAPLYLRENLLAGP